MRIEDGTDMDSLQVTGRYVSEQPVATPLTVVFVCRSQSLQDLVYACARKELPFSGPDSLWSKCVAMGWNPNSLYGAVKAAEQELEMNK